MSHSEAKKPEPIRYIDGTKVVAECLRQLLGAMATGTSQDASAAAERLAQSIRAAELGNRWQGNHLTGRFDQARALEIATETR